jgi:hypothetical protein
MLPMPDRWDFLRHPPLELVSNSLLDFGNSTLTTTREQPDIRRESSSSALKGDSLQINCLAAVMSLAAKPSQRLSGCYPAAGTSQIGDQIRERRGARGITALDAALLYNPEIAVRRRLLGDPQSNGTKPVKVARLSLC